MLVELETDRLADLLGDEWEVVRVGWPKQGETYLSDCGTEVVKSLRADVGIRIIVRRKWEWPEWIKPGTWLARFFYADEPVNGIVDWTPPPVPSDWRRSLMQKPMETK